MALFFLNGKWAKYRPIFPQYFKNDIRISSNSETREVRDCPLEDSVFYTVQGSLLGRITEYNLEHHLPTLFSAAIQSRLSKSKPKCTILINVWLILSQSLKQICIDSFKITNKYGMWAMVTTLLLLNRNASIPLLVSTSHSSLRANWES